MKLPYFDHENLIKIAFYFSLDFLVGSIFSIGSNKSSRDKINHSVFFLAKEKMKYAKCNTKLKGGVLYSFTVFKFGSLKTKRE